MRSELGTAQPQLVKLFVVLDVVAAVASDCLVVILCLFNSFVLKSIQVVK